MERLTKCVGYQNDNPIYKTNLDMRRMGSVDKLKNALGHYEDLEEQGLLLRLPCKVGDTIYHIMNVDDKSEIREMKIATLNNLVALMEYGDFGKTVFLTQTEAEQKLKEMNSRGITE